MRRLLALCLTSVLVLSACGGDSGALDDIEVSGGSNPTLDVPEGFTSAETETRVVTEGDGDEVAEGDSVKVNYLAVNGRTSEEFDNSYAGSEPVTFTLQDDAALQGFIKGLTGQAIGSRVLVAIPPDDGFGGAQEQLGIEGEDTMVFLFDLVAKVPAEASGEAEDLPDSVPQVVLEDGEPTGFEAGDDVTADPSEPAAYVAIKGEGEPVEEGASVTAHYVGQVYPDGEVFDGSWERGAPSTFSLEQVIACWRDLVPGQTIGSRVVLVCPADSAYGDEPPQGSAIGAGDTLVFAIDLLDAS